MTLTVFLRPGCPGEGRRGGLNVSTASVLTRGQRGRLYQHSVIYTAGATKKTRGAFFIGV